MKGPKELKRYVAKYREELKRMHWDHLWVWRLQYNCKNRFKRDKKINTKEWE